jgi:hypothetical protein
MRRLERIGVAATAVALGLGLSCCAQSGLSLHVGFSGVFQIGRLTPVEIVVPAAVAGRIDALQFTQRLGDAWRGEAEFTARIRPQSALPQRVRILLPIYDFTSPLAVEAIDAQGETLATATAALREGARARPLAVTIGRLPHPVAEEAVAADPWALPERWWGYDGVGVLWIGEPIETVTIPAWTAIAEWIVAGGTVVLFTGQAFPLIDSAPVRALLPWADPVLIRDAAGGTRLEGTLRPDAAIVWSDGTGLDIARRFVGLGRVYAATVNAGSLSAEQLAAIDSTVRAAGIPSLVSATAEALLDTPLQTPGHGVAAALVSTLLTVVGVAAYRVRSPRAAAGTALAGAMILAVLSGVVGDRTKRAIDVYTESTEVRILAQWGIGIDCCGMFPIRSMQQRLGSGAARIETSPRDRGERFVSQRMDVGNATTLVLPAAHDMYATSYRSEGLDVRIASVDGGLRVENRLETALDDAIVFLDGRVYPIAQPIDRGTTLLTLGDGMEGARAAFDSAVWRAVTDRLGPGIIERMTEAMSMGSRRVGAAPWLIATQRGVHNEMEEDVARKVSVLRCVIVQGSPEEA